MLWNAPNLKDPDRLFQLFFFSNIWRLWHYKKAQIFSYPIKLTAEKCYVWIYTVRYRELQLHKIALYTPNFKFTSLLLLLLLLLNLSLLRVNNLSDKHVLLFKQALVHKIITLNNIYIPYIDMYILTFKKHFTIYNLIKWTNYYRYLQVTNKGHFNSYKRENYLNFINLQPKLSDCHIVHFISYRYFGVMILQMKMPFFDSNFIFCFVLFCFFIFWW